MSDKPNIERLFEALNLFQQDTRLAMKKSPGLWQSGIEAARDRFKGKLSDLGIADLFDWTEQ